MLARKAAGNEAVLNYVHIVNRRLQIVARARGLRLPEELEEEIGREMRLRGATFSEVATQLLREAVRMRRVPGIYFFDGLDSRRAAITGTGLEVWEVVATYKSLGADREALKESYPWLDDKQLSAALFYYELYPEEIDARLSLEERWTQENVWSELPFTRPRGPASNDGS